MVKSSLKAMEERCASTQSEKNSLEQMAHSLKTELDREKKMRSELQAKKTELESESLKWCVCVWGPGGAWL